MANVAASRRALEGLHATVGAFGDSIEAWPKMPRPRQRIPSKVDRSSTEQASTSGAGLPGRRVARSFDGRTRPPATKSQTASLPRTWKASTKAGYASNLGGASIKQFSCSQATPLRWPSVVFRLPGDEPIASVLWMPSGAPRFCSRQAWNRPVAYASQFSDPDNRAHRGQAKIKSQLIADLDPDEWDLPPKPKWMRWRTYNRYVQKFDAYEDTLSQNIAELMALLLNDG